MFSGNIHYNKVVDNSFIYLMLKFGGIGFCGFFVMAVQI